MNKTTTDAIQKNGMTLSEPEPPLIVSGKPTQFCAVISTMSYKVEPVIKQVCTSIGEGPHWDATSQTLLFVDIVKGDVHRWNSVTKEDSKLHVGKHTGNITS